ncbi:MAG TPA: NADH-quinone oxidoreductase subunit F [Lentisphaeria bacterium]|nr:MAG: NADH dehydrogenase [Lentisphaerae bacterium GWF2_49_21]HBC86243.1 NADH-quinone oxidoreductase subunit F [Lentisphaeria bacterium]
MISSAEKLEEYEKGLAGRIPSSLRTEILVSMGTCGIAAGTTPILEELKKEVSEQKLDDSVKIVQVGCMGLCHSEPTIEVVDKESGQRIIFGNVIASQAKSIVAKSVRTAGVQAVARTWYCPEDEEMNPDAIQARIVLRNCGRIDPEEIDEYIMRSGYQAAAKVLASMKPLDVIKIITESGLKGRGGGGFPTGRKWKFAADQKSDEKYVVCNADEGDPGAFMDRAVLEGDPHSVLEAMIIAGFAVGSHEGVIYIRAEYPLAVKRLHLAIAQAKEKGLLGKNLFGSGFDFNIELKYGAGAFVCGEETALIHSVEGKRGEPSFKPPFPAVSGLWKKPTVVNNVETYANVCAIIRNGAAWFKKIGTENSPGTKVFSLTGKINKVGLIEVPIGTSLRDIIFKLGDGIKGGRKFKAVQTGGPSGGCITEASLDTPIDYNTLIALGSMMGSGGMIVMDEDDCMVNVAKFFLDFTLDESCGRCTPCRIGNKRLHEMLKEITDGNGTHETLTKLRKLSDNIKDTALCGLGQTSPNPVLSTIKNFEGEYLAHIDHRKCPAKVCAKLLSYLINDNCVGCTLCAKNCPVTCISGEKRQKHLIDQKKCIKCGVCYEACKFHAIDKD